MRSYDVVIVGGGPAGRTIVHTLHEHHAGLSIAVIKDEAINVNRCAVPYGINAEDPIEKFQIPNKLVSDFGAELIVESVERLDPKGKTVTLASGETIGYDKLVLATGARPFVPPIEGIESENITFVRSLADLERLRQLAAKSREVVILGGGYIGVEVAVVLKDMGLSVSLVEMQPTILGGTAEPELTEVLLAAMMEHGIHLHTERRVVKFLDNGAVELNNGSEVPGDFVVVAAGVRPDISLAEAAGLNVSKHGVVVDDHMRSVSHPDIYACGDCAQGISFFTGLPVPSEFGTNAVFMGRVVAANIMGQDRSFPGVINACVSAVIDWSFGTAGLTEAAAIAAGQDVVCGFSQVLDRYPMMHDVSDVHTNLVFARGNGRLLGGSVVRKGLGTALAVDFISFACQMRATIDDLLAFQYATHPELAAKPS
ncbi:MAG: FAD-dependent oxidoreductase, partial [Alphaproteobacteria bacterium]